MLFFIWSFFRARRYLFLALPWFCQGLFFKAAKAQFCYLSPRCRFINTYWYVSFEVWCHCLSGWSSSFNSHTSICWLIFFLSPPSWYWLPHPGSAVLSVWASLSLAFGYRTGACKSLFFLILAYCIERSTVIVLPTFRLPIE